MCERNKLVSPPITDIDSFDQLEPIWDEYEYENLRDSFDKHDTRNDFQNIDKHVIIHYTTISNLDYKTKQGYQALHC